jgi:Transposase DDE domain group 1
MPGAGRRAGLLRGARLRGDLSSGATESVCGDPWNGVDVHFYGDSDHARDRGAICLLLVDEVEELHERFRRSLRASLGRVPTSGVPRITRMRPGQTRFTVVDPAGNSVLFIIHGEPDPHEETRRLAATLSPLGKAIRNAEVLRDYKHDNAACARVLRGALARFVDADADERARAAELLADLDAETRLRPIRLSLASPDQRRSTGGASKPSTAGAAAPSAASATPKDTGLADLPSASFAINHAWLQLSLIASDLLAWARCLTLDGELARAEPKRLRYCPLHPAGIIARSGRQTRLRIAGNWPWQGRPARRRLRPPAKPAAAGLTCATRLRRWPPHVLLSRTARAPAPPTPTTRVPPPTHDRSPAPPPDPASASSSPDSY